MLGRLFGRSPFRSLSPLRSRAQRSSPTSRHCKVAVPMCWRQRQHEAPMQVQRRQRVACCFRRRPTLGRWVKSWRMVDRNDEGVSLGPARARRRPPLQRASSGGGDAHRTVPRSKCVQTVAARSSSAPSRPTLCRASAQHASLRKLHFVAAGGQPRRVPRWSDTIARPPRTGYLRSMKRACRAATSSGSIGLR